MAQSGQSASATECVLCRGVSDRERDPVLKRRAGDEEASATAVSRSPNEKGATRR